MIYLSLALIVIAALGLNAYLIVEQVNGWGWFMFFTLLVIGGISMSRETKSKDKKEEPNKSGSD